MRQINSRITIEHVRMPSPPEDSQPAPTGAAPRAPRERRRPCALQTRLERTPGAQKSLGFHGFPGLRTMESADAGLALLKCGLAVLLKSKHIYKRGVHGLSSWTSSSPGIGCLWDQLLIFKFVCREQFLPCLMKSLYLKYNCEIACLGRHSLTI